MATLLWPGHPKPRDDELLSSWIVRLAAANGMKAHTFTSLALPGHAIWNRDIDRSVKPEMLDRLARHTGTRADVVQRTTLGSFEGVVFERHNPGGSSAWILPAGVYHRSRRCHGVLYCAGCLAEATPYYRRSWRLGFSTVCPSHRRPLLDSCPSCESPIMFHRGDIGDRGVFDAAAAMTTCSSCRYDLRNTVDRIDAYVGLALSQKDIIDEAISDGNVLIGENRVHSQMFFLGLRIVTQFLAVGRMSSAMREKLAGLLGLPFFIPEWAGRLAMIEHLAVKDRLRLLVLSLALLADWPTTFIRVARSVGATASDVTGRVENVPYWLARAVDSELFAGTYTPSVPEIRSAIAYLRGRSLPVTRTNVSRLLGSSNVLRKRQLHFLLSE